MSNVQISAPEPPNNFHIPRFAPTQLSDMHVAQLIAIANHSAGMLSTPNNSEYRNDIDVKAQDTARATFELAHVRMRDLIDEQRRWSLEPSEADQKTIAILKNTEDLYYAKVQHQRLQNRPSRMLRPKLKLFNVGWIAWIGGDLPVSSDLHAVGRTPADAFAAFDNAFYDIQNNSTPARVAPVDDSPETRPAPKRRRAKR